MRRRDLLATAGTLLTAGCGSLLGGNQGGPRQSGPSDELYESDVVDGIDGEVDTNVGNIGANVSSVDTNINVTSIDTNVTSNINTSIDTNIDTSFGNDDSGTATPASEEAEQIVADATAALNEAVSVYTSFGGEDAGLMDVDATTADFQKISVRSNVREALELLDEALDADPTPGQIVNIAALEQVGVFLSNAAEAQYALVRAYDRLQFASERFYNESLTQMEFANAEMDEYTNEAVDALNRLRRETDQDAMQVLSSVSEEVYRRKEQRLQDQTDAFSDFYGGLRSMRRGLEDMQDGVPAYLAERYEDAANDFLSASASFGIGASSFTLLPGADPLRPKADELFGVATVLEQAAEDLHRSAEAQVEDDRLQFFEARRAAEDHIESNDIVRDMSTMRDIIV